MGLFNPKQYNPLAQQFGQSLLQQGMQGQAMGPWQGLAQAIQMGLGGIMMGGQNKAKKRAQGETSAGLQEAAQMQRETQPMTSAMLGGLAPMAGTQGINIPEGAEVATETEQAFKSRQSEMVMNTLLESEIPEYQERGQEMLMASLSTPSFTIEKVGDNLVKVAKDGTVVPIYEGPKKMQVDNIGANGALVTAPDGSTQFVQGIPPGDYRYTGTTPEGTALILNNDTGEIQDSGVEIKDKSGQTISVNLPGEAPPNTPATTTALQKAVADRVLSMEGFKTQMQLATSMPQEALDMVFTTPGKMKAWGLELAEKLGADLSDEHKAQLGTAAGFKAVVWDTVNAYIHRITGAQVSQHEVGRLMKAIGNPDDSYTVYMAKLTWTMNVTQNALRTYEAMLRDGVSQEEAKAAASAMIGSTADRAETMGANEWANISQMYQNTPVAPAQGTGTGVGPEPDLTLPPG